MVATQFSAAGTLDPPSPPSPKETNKLGFLQNLPEKRGPQSLAPGRVLWVAHVLYMCVSVHTGKVTQHYKVLQEKIKACVSFRFVQTVNKSIFLGHFCLHIFWGKCRETRVAGCGPRCLLGLEVHQECVRVGFQVLYEPEFLGNRN